MPSGSVHFLTGSCLIVTLALGYATNLTAADVTPAERLASRIDAAPQEHPLVPALRLADKALQKISAVADYEAIFVKKEFVSGTFVEQKMQIRFRKQPMSVYLKFLEPNEGRQVLFVKGANGGKMQVKETGLASLVGTINIDPLGATALAESKYPITMIGMENMTRRLMTEWLKATDRDDITVKFYPNAKIGGTQCQVIESTHTDVVKSGGIYRARLYIDKASGLPIRIQEFSPPQGGGRPPLLSDYTYLNVRTDVGMTAFDFDRRNSRYGF